jgi:NAD(P)H-nitrite reductase large subunit
MRRGNPIPGNHLMQELAISAGALEARLVDYQGIMPELVDVAYEGADSMNSLKHLGLPLIAVGHMEGEELRLRRNGILRTIYLQDDRIVGFRLTGDVGAAGIYRSLMNKRADVGPIKHRLLERGFGMGSIEERARSALHLT